MKYILIFFYISQVCAPQGSGHEAPPWFYMRSFDSYEDAKKAEDNLDSDARGTIVFGYSEMNTTLPIAPEKLPATTSKERIGK